MTLHKSLIILWLFLFLLFAMNKSHAYFPKNLQGIYFAEKNNVENIITELNKLAKDPYAMSLPLIASAEIGDHRLYSQARTQMLRTLNILDNQPENYPEWMRNRSFKAWMWGRILLAADSIQDRRTVVLAKNKLALLLAEKITINDYFSFLTWAWEYRVTLDSKEYALFHEKIIEDALRLTARSKENPTDHAALSDALWAWTMSLFAAANAYNQQDYTFIKTQIMFLTETNSLSKAIEIGLLRTAQSNDYPAWALAKIRLSAIIMRDEQLNQDIQQALMASISAAKNSGAMAEYVLAVLDNQLAISVTAE